MLTLKQYYANLQEKIPVASDSELETIMLDLSESIPLLQTIFEQLCPVEYSSESIDEISEANVSIEGTENREKLRSVSL